MVVSSTLTRRAHLIAALTYRRLCFLSGFGIRKDAEQMAPNLTTTEATQRASAGFGTPIGMLQQPAPLISNCYFSREEIETRSPSRLDGISLKEEKKLRRTYCRLLRELGMLLQVPQVTIATAIVFCHRFYLRQSHAKNNRYTIAISCMFLACKVEETTVSVANVARKYCAVRHADSGAEWKSDSKLEKLVLVGERLVLATINFDFTVDHPYEPLMAAIEMFSIPDVKALEQVAWSVVNDSVLQTTLCLQFTPHQIAAAAIFLAATFLEIELSTDEGGVWWEEYLQVTRRQLEEVSNQILELYKPERTHGSVSGDRQHHFAKQAYGHSQDEWE